MKEFSLTKRNHDLLTEKSEEQKYLFYRILMNLKNKNERKKERYDHIKIYKWV